MGKKKQERKAEKKEARQEAKARAERQAARSSGTSVTTWANNNRGNDQVAGMANDLYFNAASADLQTRSDVNYAKQMMPLSLEYQRGAQSIATEADLRRMSAEGAITRDLVAQQGAINTGITKLETDAVRYGYDQQLAGTRYVADKDLQGTRLQTSAQRYGYDKQLEGTKYSSDRDLEGTRYSSDRMVDATRLQTDAQRYGADRNLEGTKYGADRMVDATRLQTDATRYVSDNDLTGLREGYQSQERQIGLRGDEDRKTLRQGTDETLRLRSDARGAIAKAGGRFFG
jgi:hypothetical protein